MCVRLLRAHKIRHVPPTGKKVARVLSCFPPNKVQNWVDFIQGINNRHPRVVVVTKAEDELAWMIPMSPVKTFLLYRIKFMCKMGPGQDAVICRRQFPLRMCNAVSMHKSQSMTLERSVIDARSGVFEHGQFFVAYSRCRRGIDTGLLIHQGQSTVRNIVLQRFLEDETMTQFS